LLAGIRRQDSCGSAQASCRGRAHLSYALHLILLSLGNKWQRLIRLGVQDAAPCREVLSVAHCLMPQHILPWLAANFLDELPLC